MVESRDSVLAVDETEKIFRIVEKSSVNSKVRETLLIVDLQLVCRGKLWQWNESYLGSVVCSL